MNFKGREIKGLEILFEMNGDLPILRHSAKFVKLIGRENIPCHNREYLRTRH